MAARTVAAMGEEMARFMPGHLAGPAAPLIGSYAAAMQAGESAGYDAAEASTVGGASGIWLDLVARGDGIARQDGEEDVDLRARLRTPQLGVTASNIAAAANAILAEYTSEQAYVLSWEDGAYLGETYLGETLLMSPPRFFILVVPLIGTAIEFGGYLGVDYLSDLYLGTGGEHPVYAAIWALVDRLRAAGVRWVMHIGIPEV